ncbi:LacI family DNA-binding transcriptional regulator [soil metagenome]
MVKIRDVAREAGVSVATVSRALNGLSTVNPEFAERVQEAADRLGYRPNAIARGLRRQKTDVLALIISDVTNPFFTAIARGVEDVAQANGYSVILCNSDESPDKEQRYLSVAEVEQVAGVILSPHSAATDVSRLTSAGVPLVVIDRPLVEPRDSVMVLSVDGARTATRHLIDEGWGHPACITGPDDAATALDRLQGYRLALADAGIPGEIFAHGEFTQAGGAAAVAELLNGLTTTGATPDSYFVANAPMALGVISELRERGIRIGRDVGVITFDDAPWAPFIDPPMSVITQPAYEIGTAAAELLFARITGAETGAPRSVILETSLLVRGSSRRGYAPSSGSTG